MHRIEIRIVSIAIQTVVNSWTAICNTVMNAEDFWWQDKNDEEGEEALDVAHDDQEVVDLQQTHVDDMETDNDKDEDTASGSECFLTAEN
jgi:hypothetical protein